MKKMFKKLFLMMLLLSGMLVGIFLLSSDEKYSEVFADFTNSREYMNVGTDEVLPRLERVCKKDEATKLIIGAFL